MQRIYRSTLLPNGVSDIFGHNTPAKNSINTGPLCSLWRSKHKLVTKFEASPSHSVAHSAHDPPSFDKLNQSINMKTSNVLSILVVFLLGVVGTFADVDAADKVDAESVAGTIMAAKVGGVA